MSRTASAATWAMSLMLAWAGVASAEAEVEKLPDVHPPIGVFGEVVRASGKVMLSYRYHVHADSTGTD